MNLTEAIRHLKNNGFVCESAVKGDFIAGEHGGEPFYDLPNDFTKTDALRYFLCGCTNFIKLSSSDEKVKEYAETRLPKSRLAQFQRTWRTIQPLLEGKDIKVYRGLVISDDNEVDVNKAGECWTFMPGMARRWVDEIVDKAAAHHVLQENTRKYILSGKVNINNCRLPYSFWLAGRFERPEWEIRVQDEAKVMEIKYKEIE